VVTCSTWTTRLPSRSVWIETIASFSINSHKSSFYKIIFLILNCHTLWLETPTNFWILNTPLSSQCAITLSSSKTKNKLIDLINGT
jgi:hypothetical protein